MSRRCCATLACSWVSELNEKVLEQFFIIFIQENFYFSPESLIEAAETDPYAKESTTLIRDMFRICALPMI